MADRRFQEHNLEINTAIFKLASTGKVFDLSSGWWPGMPLAPGHPPFQVLTFRTPMGEKNQKDLEFFGENQSNFRFISELLSFCAHSGTHIDALSHITLGEKNEWFGGYSADDYLGDFGPLNNDASTLPPYITRGVLLDVPGALGVDRLNISQRIDSSLIKKTLNYQEIDLKIGDTILIRTGMMANWPDVSKMDETTGSGIDLDAAEFLSKYKPALIGADTPVVELMPSGVIGEPQPVHRLLIHDLGIPLMEWVYLEELAGARAYEFLFISLPIPIKGATGSLIR
jgi:kynurenine formamidase